MSTEPVPVPITSQIPGLSDLPPEFDDKPREMYFKDTDSKYIRLAKQGGRKGEEFIWERDDCISYCSPFL